MFLVYVECYKSATRSNILISVALLENIFNTLKTASEESVIVILKFVVEEESEVESMEKLKICVFAQTAFELAVSYQSGKKRKD